MFKEREVGGIIMIKDKDKCVICKKEDLERCIGGDRLNKEYLHEFNIDFESIYTDSWKGCYFVCWNCLGKYKKEKQKQFLTELEDMEDEYLNNGSPTWYQSGKMEAIWFFIKRTKEIIESPNSFDSSFDAWLRGTFEAVEDIKSRLGELR